MPSIKIIGGNGLGKIKLIDYKFSECDSVNDDISESFSPRKRQKLDHLTEDEKLLRR